MRGPMDRLQRHPVLRIHAERLSTIIDQVSTVSPWVGVQLGDGEMMYFHLKNSYDNLVILGHILPILLSLTVPSSCFELQRLCQLHLALVSALQHRHLIFIIIV